MSGWRFRNDEEGDGFSGFGIAGHIWRGWIVPVGGSTPDRHFPTDAALTGASRRESAQSHPWP